MSQPEDQPPSQSQDAPPGEPNASYPFQLYPGYPTYLPPAPPKPHSLAFKVTIGALIALVILAPFGLIAGAVYGVPAYRAWYQNELIRRVHAQQPLFKDALTYNTYNWPIQETDKYQRSYFYSIDGYHLKGTDPNRLMYAWGSTDSTDVAIELTAKQHSSAQNDGVGVLVRASSDGHDIIAYVTAPRGYWWIGRYHYATGDAEQDWHILGSGRSSAIRTGEDVQNQLLVIKRKNSYFCFVNGRYLGVYRDYSPDLRYGYSGVYLNTSVVEGIFRDFTVYPAPSTDIFAKD
jgi:hypothetical protein